MPEDKMGLRKANLILQNPKDYWSHEVDEAKEYAIKAIDILCNSEEVGIPFEKTGEIVMFAFTRGNLIALLDNIIARKEQDGTAVQQTEEQLGKET